MKGSDDFKKVITAYLEKRAAEDELFAVTFKKEKKNIDDCITYILNTVQASKRNGFADDEIFSMAVHYYDEDDLKPGSKSSASVVLNHTIELTESDLADAKAKAMSEAIADAKKNIKLDYIPELDEKDLAEIKEKAVAKAVIEAKQKMLEKKAKPKSKLIPAVNVEEKTIIQQPEQTQGSLF